MPPLLIGKNIIFINFFTVVKIDMMHLASNEGTHREYGCDESWSFVLRVAVFSFNHVATESTDQA